MIDNAATITITKNHLAATIGDEVVLLGLTTGTYYGLEAVAAHIWRHLQQPRTFDDLVNEIVCVFDVTRIDAVRDVSAFIRTLEAEGLASVSSEPAS